MYKDVAQRQGERQQMNQKLGVFWDFYYITFLLVNNKTLELSNGL